KQNGILQAGCINLVRLFDCHIMGNRRQAQGLSLQKKQNGILQAGCINFVRLFDCHIMGNRRQAQGLSLQKKQTVFCKQDASISFGYSIAIQHLFN
ncbi:MAG: hypothetical protein ACRC26_09515, partial [Bacteroidales bacterium]